MHLELRDAPAAGKRQFKCTAVLFVTHLLSPHGQQGCAKPAKHKPNYAWKEKKPHQYRVCDEADALVCLFRLNPDVAARYCPDIAIDGNTGVDDILLAMFEKLGGELERVRQEPVRDGTRTERRASLFRITRKTGRPCREAAVHDAAARLVGKRWREYKCMRAKEQRDKSAHAAARAARPRVGTFTQRGTAITGVKSACSTTA